MKSQWIRFSLIFLTLCGVLLACEEVVEDPDSNQPTQENPGENPGDDGDTGEDGSDDGSGTITFSQALLEEMNFVRTKPSEYAEKVLKSYYQQGKDNGAYNELKNTAPISALNLQTELNKAAGDYAKFLGDNNKWGHNENGSPSDRCKAAGYDNYSGENIAAGSYSYLNGDNDPEGAAKAFILMWIIDEGVQGVGHRKNILSSNHKKMGGGFYNAPGSTYKNYAVQDFGSK